MRPSLERVRDVFHQIIRNQGADKRVVGTATQQNSVASDAV